MIVLRIRSTQKPQSRKPQYSKTAVLKIRCTQNPQFLKYDSYKKQNFTKNVDNCLKFPNHPSKSLYYFCISHCTLRKSMTMVYKFHLVWIVNLFSKPPKRHLLSYCRNNFEIKDRENYPYL